jgi:hypothetical protein
MRHHLIKSSSQNQPGYLLPCIHPTHSEYMLFVGAGGEEEIRAALQRSGGRPATPDEIQDGFFDRLHAAANFQPWDCKLIDPDPRATGKNEAPKIIVEVPPGVEWSGDETQIGIMRATANAARAAWIKHGPAIKAACAAGQKISIPAALKHVSITLDNKLIYSPGPEAQYNLRIRHRKETK